MKRLNLNETWVLCLKMWKWIAKEVEAGRDSITDVIDLKDEWLTKHGFRDVEENCFFCDYARRKAGCLQSCPGKKIDGSFNCDNKEYHYAGEPIAFYKKLVELNKIRLKKKV